MGYDWGNMAWGWLFLIPFLVMLGLMVMMFAMARRCFMGWRHADAFGERMSGGVEMENQSAHKWKGMRGSMMQSCMEMMGRRMPVAEHDRGMQGVFDRWSKDLEQKVLDLLDRGERVGSSHIAVSLGIPEEVALSLIHRLALEGKVHIGSVEKTK